MICFNWCLNREYDGDITGYNGISMAYESGFNLIRRKKQLTTHIYIYILVGGLEHGFYFSIQLGITIPTDLHIV